MHVRRALSVGITYGIPHVDVSRSRPVYAVPRMDDEFDIHIILQWVDAPEAFRESRAGNRQLIFDIDISAIQKKVISTISRLVDISAIQNGVDISIYRQFKLAFLNKCNFLLWFKL